MRKKQLIITVLIMVVLVVASLLTRKVDKSQIMQPGDKVFSGIDSSNIERMIFESTAAKASTELILKDNKWVLKNKYNMDADPAVIRKLFLALEESKAIHVIDHKDEDLNLFLLSDDNTVKAEFYTKGSDKPLVFRFGKSHSFKQGHTGRYVYIESNKALVLLDTALTFIAGQSSVWLKKFLPYHEQVAGVTFYSGSNILWKTERNSTKVGFSLPLPKNNNKTPQQINEIMVYAMQMRFMDIVEPTNDFTIDPDLRDMAIYYSTFSGRTYKLSFLKKEGHLVRCSLKLISNKVKSSFTKDYGSEEQLKEALSEWHYTVPYKFYEMLFKI